MEMTVAWRKILNLLRISYTLPFVMASVTGAAFALSVSDELLLAILIPLDVFFLAMFVNLSNDYFDHKSGTDATRFSFMTPELKDSIKEIYDERIYWDGNAFDKGEVSERHGRIIIGLIALGALLVSLPIILHGGWLVVILGAVAFFLSYFYTAPPLNLGARGLGELDVGASFFMMSFFTYYVIVQDWSGEMFLIALTVGLTVMLMRFVDQMSGYQAHLEGGEKDWCVRLGLEKAVNVVAVLLVALYILCLGLIYFNALYALLLLTIPLARGLLQGLRNKEDKLRFIRPAPQMFKLALGNQILVIISLIVQSVLPWTLW
ncbi:MAG: prenyltransferase [Methanomassiliicoccales archaeon]|nr:prenyltransferase [Methanomassiliicoccales archaeon]